MTKKMKILGTWEAKLLTIFPEKKRKNQVVLKDNDTIPVKRNRIILKCYARLQKEEQSMKNWSRCRGTSLWGWCVLDEEEPDRKKFQMRTVGRSLTIGGSRTQRVWKWLHGGTDAFPVLLQGNDVFKCLLPIWIDLEANVEQCSPTHSVVEDFTVLFR